MPKLKQPIQEEELKNTLAKEFFAKFDHTKILEKIDFAVKAKSAKDSRSEGYFLWAEAKAHPTDLFEMLAQLVLTIGETGAVKVKNEETGKEEDCLPPAFLGCFDNEKIVFVPYYKFQDVFRHGDMIWDVRPSNNKDPNFLKVTAVIKNVLGKSSPSCIYEFSLMEKKNRNDVIKQFIQNNFVIDKMGVSKIQINKNNFITIYFKWLVAVKPHIQVNWAEAKKVGIIDGDFYIADLLSSENNEPVKKFLFVKLMGDKYKLDKHTDDLGLETSKEALFADGQVAHNRFWAIYERPPLEEYWDYIVKRRDLLVPQDVRERKGSFFTPKIWVELSQKYIADVLGEDWQENYTVWDCAAGTGNLLAGLTEKYNIWASTLDKADVDVIKDRIANGANLLPDHVFQFDFLNDDFSKLPEGLLKIINDPEKRKKLVIYINPPYAEGDNRKGEGRSGVASSRVHSQYSEAMGYAKREMYIQFLMRVYKEINGAIIANFSKLKNLQASKFHTFRQNYMPKLKSLFLVPANTFDNVKGQFPISFQIWDTRNKEMFQSITADVYDDNCTFIAKKVLYSYDDCKFINDWTLTFIDEQADSIGTIIGIANDFQNQDTIRIENPHKPWNHQYQWQISKKNLIESAIYYAVRKVIPATWINDRDQFLFPDDKYAEDSLFQSDCLTYLLFSNNILVKPENNNWIPFTEEDVKARTKFVSNFMTNYISGKIRRDKENILVPDSKTVRKPASMVFSSEAQAVFKAGKELWLYYHKQPSANLNAGLYNIREHFKGRDETTGRMKSKSNDEQFNLLDANLRSAVKALAKMIEPKIYEYGFLKR
jgi:hypothetical protein